MFPNNTKSAQHIKEVRLCTTEFATSRDLSSDDSGSEAHEYTLPWRVYVCFHKNKKPEQKDETNAFHMAMDACVFSRYPTLYPATKEGVGSNWLKNPNAQFLRRYEPKYSDVRLKSRARVESSVV
jgi:hypothetical protein